MTPGINSFQNSGHSMLRWSRWLIPDTAVVNTSTTWIRADAVAGGTPITATSRVLQITPNAMPSAPSTSCAAKPIRMKGNSEEGSSTARSNMTSSQLF